MNIHTHIHGLMFFFARTLHCEGHCFKEAGSSPSSLVRCHEVVVPALSPWVPASRTHLTYFRWLGGLSHWSVVAVWGSQASRLKDLEDWLLDSPIFERVISVPWTSNDVKRNLQVQNQGKAPHRCLAALGKPMGSLMLSGWREYSHLPAVTPTHGSALCRHINIHKQPSAWKQVPLASG